MGRVRKRDDGIEGQKRQDDDQQRKIDAVPSDISPLKFWKDYISQRKPVLIEGHPIDPEWTASQNWSIEYLKNKAGSVPVEAEYRQEDTEGFGRGTKRRMTFAQVLDKVSSGDASLYMTTQGAKIGPDGHPEIMSPPTTHLAMDFPLRLRLFGNLIPQQTNMWLGCAKSDSGASSGLHHDFHDNLYVLLWGRKRFRLFSPQQAHAMYVNGTIHKIHKNGRIVYKDNNSNNHETILADGSDKIEIEAWYAKYNAEQELAAAEEAASRGDPGSRKRLAKAEEALDCVLEAALEADDTFDDFYDDFEAMNNNTRLEKGPIKDGEEKQKEEDDPPSFSKIDLNLSEKQLQKRFPLFPGLETAIEFEMTAGQMLYIPAGWFHEVTSYSTDTDKNIAHLAFNFWMHPPDNLDASRNGFEKPYVNDLYWQYLWKERENRYKSIIPQNSPVENKSAKVEEKEEEEEEEEEEKETKTKRRKKCNHDGCTHHHEIMTRGERAHFLHGIRGLFGYGRRHHLYKFVNAKWK